MLGAVSELTFYTTTTASLHGDWLHDDEWTVFRDRISNSIPIDACLIQQIIWTRLWESCTKAMLEFTQLELVL